MKERRLKVGYVPGRSDERPRLVLQGLWLEELGFHYGDEVHVKAVDGKLMVIREKEEGK